MTSDQAEVAWQRVKDVCSEADPNPNPPNMELILYPYPEYEKGLLQACQAAVAAGAVLKSSLPLIIIMCRVLCTEKTP